MSFFDKIFKKNNISETYEESDWDKVQNDRELLDMHDPLTRETYVRNCLEQMKEASNELDRVNAEYALVTSYLTDMEEIEALPKDKKSKLEAIAKHIHDLKKEHDQYVLHPGNISSRDFDRMDNMKDDIEDAINKLKDEEGYRDKVKADLRRLDKERAAYNYRKTEVTNAIENARGIATIAMVASVVLLIVLFLLQMLLKFDVALGYYIAVAVCAVSLTVIYLKYTDYTNEKKKIENTINELILLENKVKIRYVNNRNLLDYLYTKYDVESAKELRNLYNSYLKEREDRRKFERNEAVYRDENDRLMKILHTLPIKDPQIWIHQTDALYDSKEMVEIRHGLIQRRQKLRKQMEYNEQIALEASEEVKQLINEYPEYAESLLELVKTYE